MYLAQDNSEVQYKLLMFSQEGTRSERFIVTLITPQLVPSSGH